MNGTNLMKNLNWIGKMNNILNKVADDDNDDNDGILIGGGIDDHHHHAIDEHELRKALPEMTKTLKNWTLHGQCLGDMVECYKCNNYDYMAKQRSEIGHFFNMTSSILETIGSMVENSILRSAEFHKNNTKQTKEVYEVDQLLAVGKINL